LTGFETDEQFVLLGDSPGKKPKLLKTLRPARRTRTLIRATVLGLATLTLIPRISEATTTTTTFAVTATVQSTCLVSATAMAFGTYTGVAATGTSTVSVTCTNTTTYNVGLNAGLASGASVTTRQMTGPSSSLLNYALYKDSSRTVNWGVTIGTDTATGTGNGSAQPITVYGAIPANQYVTPGAFTDTITATITY
jgi:spore coat protein U-like protein